jgi:serine/threonine protein kinase
MGKISLESISACPSASCRPKHPHPASRVADQEFWVARIRKIPKFICSPWDFYEPFLELSAHLSLVLCNEGTEVRTMRTFDAAFEGEVASEDSTFFPLLEIQHPNFVDICEAYLFRNEISAIVEYIGFSVEDLLQHSIYPTEREIAYVISQVSMTIPLLKLTPMLTLQVLTGIRFIWSRKLPHPRISTQNILISLKGEVKIGKAPNTQNMPQI